MIQHASTRDYDKNTFTSFATKIFNPVQAKMVLDHIAGAHAVSSPLHTVYAYQIVKAVTINNSLAQELSTSHL